MIFKKSILLGCIILGLSSCGGGGDDDTANPANTTSLASDQPASDQPSNDNNNIQTETIGTVVSGGVWLSSSPTLVEGIISPTGELHLTSTSKIDGEYFHISSQLDATKTVINSSTVSVYQSIEDVREIATLEGTGTVSGDISVSDNGWINIEGTFNYEGESHRLMLENLGGYNDSGAELDTIDGNWIDYISEEGMSYGGGDLYSTISLAIDIDGLITGSDDSGCIFEGTTSIDDPTLNSYSMSITVSTCEAAGDYTGVAYTNSTSKVLFLYLSNGTNSYALKFN